MKNSISGTVKELIEMGLTVNGVKMDQTALSFLTRLGIARAVGVAPKSPGRGKASTIWELDESITTTMTASVTGTPPLLAVAA